jgi:predicted CXXCH cytochrome family protein
MRTGFFILLNQLLRRGGLLPLLLLLASPATAALQLVYPEPSSFVVSSRHLIFKLGGQEITGVVVTVNGVSSDPLPVGTTEYKRAFRDFLILQPLWDKGINKLTVDTFAGEQKLESFKTEIYYAPASGGGDIPKEFKRTSLHRSDAEPLCVPCHNMKPTARQVTDVPDKDNACYSCHKRMGNQKYVHGPVSTYSCVYCHPLQSTPKYATVKRETKLCFECHVEKQKELKSFKFLHGPIAADMCEVCHDPHSSENPDQLHQSVNKLCLSCHDLIAKEIHAIALGDGTGHPISGKTDPSERGKGRELSCISCHDPHGGKARYYFVTGNDNKMELCQICHKK